MPTSKRQPPRKKPNRKPRPAAAQPPQQSIGRMTGGVAANRIQAATFVGRDQHITYGFGPKDVEHIIRHLVGLIAGGGTLLPAADSDDAVRIEHDGEALTFPAGVAQRFEKKRNLRSHLLAVTVHQDFRVWATKFVPLAGKMYDRKTVAGMDIPVS